jgi:hypothetical protein
LTSRRHSFGAKAIQSRTAADKVEDVGEEYDQALAAAMTATANASGSGDAPVAGEGGGNDKKRKKKGLFGKKSKGGTSAGSPVVDLGRTGLN